MKSKRGIKEILGIYEPKHRVTMHKSKKQWVTKGLLFGTLLLAGSAVGTTSVQGQVWTPNLTLNKSQLASQRDKNQSK